MDYRLDSKKTIRDLQKEIEELMKKPETMEFECTVNIMKPSKYAVVQTELNYDNRLN